MKYYYSIWWKRMDNSFSWVNERRPIARITDRHPLEIALLEASDDNVLISWQEITEEEHEQYHKRFP